MPNVEQLMVVEPIGDHGFGDRITDPAAMRRALAHHPHHVVREVVEAREEPRAAAEPAAGAKKPRGASE